MPITRDSKNIFHAVKNISTLAVVKNISCTVATLINRDDSKTFAS